MLNGTTPRYGVVGVRVSSTGQGVDGDSPEAQVEQAERFAASRGIVVKKFFTFLESASKEQQPMQEAIDYCKDPKNGIDVFIVKSIDRFTRAGSYSYDTLKKQLDAANVALIDIYGVISDRKINTLEHLGVEYGWSIYNPTKKAEMLEAERANDEIRDIMSRMIGAEIRYARMGYWVREAPFGYKTEKIETPHGKRCILVPHPIESRWVSKIFELRARGTHTDRQIVDEINNMGYKSRVEILRDKRDRTKMIGQRGGKPLRLKVLWYILENPIYAGINAEKWTEGKPLRCKFDGLISVELFNQANKGKVYISEQDGEIIIGKKQPPKYLVTKGIRNADFPYKKQVMCPHCEKPLFGSASRGKLGKYYAAYHCSRSHPYFRVSKKDFDETITNFVKGIRISPEYVEALTKAVVTEWERREAEAHKDDVVIDTRITELRGEATAAMDKIKFLSSETVIKHMEEQILNAEAQIADLTAQKEKAENEEKKINMKTVMEYIKYFLEHLEYLVLQQMNPVAKAGYFGVLFDKAPTFDEIKFGTPKTAVAIELNRLFSSKNMNDDVMAGDSEPIPSF